MKLCTKSLEWEMRSLGRCLGQEPPTMQLEQCEYSIMGLVKRKLKCALDIQVQSFVYKIKYLAS